MIDLETTIASIEDKVCQLVAENEQLREKVASEHDRNEVLQKALEEKNILINNLNEQNKVLKLGNTLTQKGDSVEIKLKINQLIRTIDKSLALLSKTE